MMVIVKWHFEVSLLGWAGESMEGQLFQSESSSEHIFSLFKAPQNFELFDFSKTLVCSGSGILASSRRCRFWTYLSPLWSGLLAAWLEPHTSCHFFLSAAASSSSVCVFVFDGPSQCTALWLTVWLWSALELWFYLSLPMSHYRGRTLKSAATRKDRKAMALKGKVRKASGDRLMCMWCTNWHQFWGIIVLN